MAPSTPPTKLTIQKPLGESFTPEGTSEGVLTPSTGSDEAMTPPSVASEGASPSGNIVEETPSLSINSDNSEVILTPSASSEGAPTFSISSEGMPTPSASHEASPTSSTSSEGVSAASTSSFQGDPESPTMQRKKRNDRLSHPPPRFIPTSDASRSRSQIFGARPPPDFLGTPPNITHLVEEAEKNPINIATLQKIKLPDILPYKPQTSFTSQPKQSSSPKDSPTVSTTAIGSGTSTGSTTPTGPSTPTKKASPAQSVGSPEAQHARTPPTPAEKGTNKFYFSSKLGKAELIELPRSPKLPDAKDVMVESTVLFVRLLVDIRAIVIFLVKTFFQIMVRMYVNLGKSIMSVLKPVFEIISWLYWVSGLRDTAKSVCDIVVELCLNILKFVAVLLVAAVLISIYSPKTSRDWCQSYGVCIPHYSNISISHITDHFQQTPATKISRNTAVEITIVPHMSVIDHIVEVTSLLINANINYDQILHLQRDAYNLGNICLHASGHHLAPREREVTEGSRQCVASIKGLQDYLSSLVEAKVWSLSSIPSLKLARGELEKSKRQLEKMRKNKKRGEVVKFEPKELQKILVEAMEVQIHNSLTLKEKIYEGREALHMMESNYTTIEHQLQHNYFKLIIIPREEDKRGLETFRLRNKDPIKLDRDLEELQQKEEEVHHDNLLAITRLTLSVERLKQYFYKQDAALATIIDVTQEFTKTLSDIINYTEDILGPEKIREVDQMIVSVGESKQTGEQAMKELQANICPTRIARGWKW